MKLLAFLHDYEPIREWFISEINKSLTSGKRAERQEEFTVRTVTAIKSIMDSRKVRLNENELMLFLYSDIMNSYRNHFGKRQPVKPL